MDPTSRSSWSSEVPPQVNQASYDVSRLARNGLIACVPDRSRYTLTPDGLLFACFYTLVYDYVLRLLMAPTNPRITRTRREAPPGAPGQSIL
jgi:hypothetical protein